MNTKHGFGMTSTFVGLAAAVGLGFGGYTLLSASGNCSACDSATGTTLTENAMVVSEPVTEIAKAEEALPSCCAEDAEAEAVALAATDPDCSQCDADMAKDCPMDAGQCEGDMANCPHATGDCTMQDAKDCPMGSMDNCPMQDAKDNCPMKGTPDCPMQNAKNTEADSTDGNG